MYSKILKKIVKKMLLSTNSIYIFIYFLTGFLTLVNFTITNIRIANDDNLRSKIIFSFSKGIATKANTIATISSLTVLYLKKFILTSI